MVFNCFRTRWRDEIDLEIASDRVFDAEHDFDVFQVIDLVRCTAARVTGEFNRAGL